MRTPLIQFDQVFKSFGGKSVLQGVDLEIFAGETTTIIGKSGIGKSVLLKHIIGLLAPDSGRVLFDGRPLAQMSGSQLRAIKTQCSYMFQNSALFDSLTVFENIALPLKERRLAKGAGLSARVRSTMAQLDIAEIENNYPAQLSGGMKKRVALARALVTEPSIVLFDEPTTGLDPVRKNAVHRMIAEHQHRFGFTGIMVSHEIPDVFHISQRIAMLEGGRIIFQGACRELQTSQHPAIRAFIDNTAVKERIA
ncbi:MAG: ATP-binding cassette domain-containing protein [Desulfatitalea sp.]|nr:ATP-binding cassette domain-containing protein [Desulfatitalea sp.]NNK00369.1 ATP-binding cassette domain-containing protein [Desulfatitalea sp.]